MSLDPALFDAAKAQYERDRYRLGAKEAWRRLQQRRQDAAKGRRAARFMRERYGVGGYAERALGALWAVNRVSRLVYRGSWRRGQGLVG